MGGGYGLTTAELIEDVDPVHDDRWAEMVLQRRTDVFHSPRWLSILRNVYGFEIRSRVLSVDGRLTAGMVYAIVEDAFGRRLISLPFSDFCDPLVVDAHEWALLSEELLAPQVPFTVKTLFDRLAEDDARLGHSGTVAWHRCDVSREPDAIWAGFHSGARRAVRKSEASGVSVRKAETVRDMREFFELHLRTRKMKYGLLAQPWTFFEAIWNDFLEPGHGELLLAESDGRPVAGVVFLRWKETLYYKFNASDVGTLDLRPNDALMWEGIQRAHHHGDSWVDFGVSDLDQPGLIRYKEKYATESGTVRTLRRILEAEPAAASGKSVLPTITGLLTDPSVPDDITERAGEQLYRFFA